MIYILAVERWGGSAYYTELVDAYADEELANKHALDLQGGVPKHDTRYYVEEINLIGDPVR